MRAKAERKRAKEERKAKKRLKATIESAQKDQDADFLDYQKTLSASTRPRKKYDDTESMDFTPKKTKRVTNIIARVGIIVCSYF